MSIAAQLYKQQAAQRSRDVSHGSVLSGIESEKAIERGQASRALDKYSKSADLGQKLGKWGGQALGSTILRGLMLANPVTAPFALFAPAIGTALGQGAATLASWKGAKDLEEKYGSGHLARTFKDMGSDQLTSGLTRAALSGLQSGLMTKFAPSTTGKAVGEKAIKKQLTGLKPGDKPGFLKAMIERHAPESLLSLQSPGITANLQALGVEPQSLLTSEQIANILAEESENIGFQTSILQGLYDLGFGSPTFSWDEQGGK